MSKQNDIIEARKRWGEYVKQSEMCVPEEERIGYELTKNIREKLARGEIIDETLRKWLEGEITAARVALAIGIILTALIKGQVVIWLILYLAYRCRVKKVKQEAWEKTMKDYGRYLK